jgi:hypothetical protein
MTATIYGKQFGGPYWLTADDWQEAVDIAEAAVDQNWWCPAVIVDDATQELLLRRFMRADRFGLLSPCPTSDDWVFVAGGYPRRDQILAEMGVQPAPEAT